MYPTNDTYRRPVVLPNSGGNARYASRRPIARHRREPKPTTQIPATPPRSGKHRRRMLKASYRGLSFLLHRPVAVLVAADVGQLMAWAEAMRPGDGLRGEARRLAAKVGRLR